MRAPTLQQLLNLADRAERGPLSAAEAARLREGIRHLDTGKRAANGRLAHVDARKRDVTGPLAVVVRRVRASQKAGNRTIAVWVLARDLSDVLEDAA